MKTWVYACAFAGLLALLGLTLAGHALHWGLAAALSIAAAKVLLVAIYFMHLNASSSTVRSTAVAGLIFIAILMLLTLSDYSNRGASTAPSRSHFL
jgi:caa(3)-type oxidase subunit IV